MSPAHRWAFCPMCMCAMVLCGHCGNNTCNGGTGDSCPDDCASAHAWEVATVAPADLLEQANAARAEWEAMTEDQRDARNQKRFATEFGLDGSSTTSA